MSAFSRVVPHQKQHVILHETYEPRGAHHVFRDSNDNSALEGLASALADVGNVDLLIQGSAIGRNSYECSVTVDVRRNGMLNGVARVSNFAERANAFLFGPAPTPNGRVLAGMRQDELPAHMRARATQATQTALPQRTSTSTPPPAPPNTSDSTSMLGNAFRWVGEMLACCIDFFVAVITYPFR